MLGRALQPLLRGTVRTGGRRYHGAPANYKPAVMDDLPIPQGCWKQQYKKKQVKYNTQLIVSGLFLAGTLLFAKESGMVYLNFAPPERPAKS